MGLGLQTALMGGPCPSWLTNVSSMGVNIFSGLSQCSPCRREEDCLWVSRCTSGDYGHVAWMESPKEGGKKNQRGEELAHRTNEQVKSVRSPEEVTPLIDAACARTCYAGGRG